MKTVSIIMGTYNDEATLERSIESMISQTFQDWIFIICDDGSIDNTYVILQQYKSTYPDKFVILKHQTNKGLTYSLNHCLQYASGKYIARMDSDDISLPDRLEEEVAFLDNHPEYAFTGCAVERFDESGVWKKCKTTEKPEKTIFLRSSGFVHPTIMIRKEALDKVNGYNDVWYTNRCEDYDLWMRLYAAGYIGHNIEHILFQYYEGKNSISKKKYKYRICEAVMRAKGYYRLGLYPKGIIYILKPLAVGLLPAKMIQRFHNRKEN